jgi:ADP-heptose:LPS heptosyltransferase
VQAIKDSLPDVSIDVMMTLSYKVLYNNHPAISSVIPYNQKYLFHNPLRFLSLIKKNRRNNYDAVFSSNNPDAFSVSQAILCRLIAKNRSVGFAHENSPRFYSDIVKGNANIHYSQSQYDLWRHFDEDARYFSPKVYFVKNNYRPPSRAVLLWLGATGDKIIPESLLISIMQELKQHSIMYHMAVGPHDQKITEVYQKSWKNEIQTIDLDLMELGRYFLDYKCIIMPDTGPMHLVAALSIALIQVFVNSDMTQYGYTGSDRYIINQDLHVESLLKFIQSHIS